MDSTSHPLLTYYLIGHQTLQDSFIYQHHSFPNPCLREATNPLYRTGLEQTTAHDEARRNKTKQPPPNKQTNNYKTKTKTVERWVYCGESKMELVPSREETIISCILEYRQRRSMFYSLHQAMKNKEHY